MEEPRLGDGGHGEVREEGRSRTCQLLKAAGILLPSPTLSSPSDSKAASLSPRSVQGRGDRSGEWSALASPCSSRPPGHSLDSTTVPHHYLQEHTGCTPLQHRASTHVHTRVIAASSLMYPHLCIHSFIHSFHKVLSTCSGLDPMLGAGDRGEQGSLGFCPQNRTSEGGRMLTSDYPTLWLVLRPGEHMGGSCCEVKG